MNHNEFLTLYFAIHAHEDVGFHLLHHDAWIEWAMVRGVVARKSGPNGLFIDLAFTVMRGGQIKLIPITHSDYVDVFSYERFDRALLHFLTWDPHQQAEPDGWVRHQPSNRRRPGGDPEKEYVKP